MKFLPSIPRQLVHFFAVAGVILFVFSLHNLYVIHASRGVHPDLTRGSAPINILLSKTKNFPKLSNRVKVLYFGCSRTYFNIDCQIMDRSLSTNSYNLGAITHWLPSQYAQLNDLLPYINPDTTIVWSIGHHLFDNYGQAKVNDVYPIPWRLIPSYVKMGYSWTDIAENILEYQILVPWADYIPFLSLYAYRDRYAETLNHWLNQSFGAKPDQSETNNSDKIKYKNLGAYLHFRQAFVNKPGVLQVGAETNENIITAAMLRKTQGNIILHELEPEHFRAYQAAHWRVSKVRMEFVPEKKYWKTFQAMLDLMQDRGLHVIINEFWDAPYIYGDQPTRVRYEDFMDSLRTYVEARGIPYIRIDQRNMPNDAYFDSDHFNSKGVILYNPLLAKALKPYINN